MTGIVVWILWIVTVSWAFKASILFGVIYLIISSKIFMSILREMDKRQKSKINAKLDKKESIDNDDLSK